MVCFLFREIFVFSLEKYLFLCGRVCANEIFPEALFTYRMFVDDY